MKRQNVRHCLRVRFTVEKIITLLHKDDVPASPLVKALEVTSSNHSSPQAEAKEMLSTIVVLIKDRLGNFHKYQCLIDN